MKFNLAVPAEVTRAREYFNNLVEKKSLAEVKKISPKRTLNQNSYLHLLINAFAVHFGWTAAEAKIKYKRINKDLYYYEKNDEPFLKSSADLSKEDMAKSIDRFRDFSEEQGYPLPLATDQGWLREIENAIEQARYFL